MCDDRRLCHRVLAGQPDIMLNNISIATASFSMNTPKSRSTLIPEPFSVPVPPQLFCCLVQPRGPRRSGGNPGLACFSLFLLPGLARLALPTYSLGVFPLAPISMRSETRRAPSRRALRSLNGRTPLLRPAPPATADPGVSTVVWVYDAHAHACRRLISPGQILQTSVRQLSRS